MEAEKIVINKSEYDLLVRENAINEAKMNIFKAYMDATEGPYLDKATVGLLLGEVKPNEGTV